MSSCEDDDSCSTVGIGPPVDGTAATSTTTVLTTAATTETFETTITILPSSSDTPAETLISGAPAASIEQLASTSIPSASSSSLTSSTSEAQGGPATSATPTLAIATTQDAPQNTTAFSAADSASNDGKILSKGALAGTIVGTATSSIILTFFIYLLIRHHRCRCLKRHRSAASPSSSLVPMDPSDLHEKDSSAESTWSPSHYRNQVSGATAESTGMSSTLVPPSTSSWHGTDTTMPGHEHGQRSVVRGQWLPMIHELPSRNESWSDGPLVGRSNAWLADEWRTGMSTPTTEGEPDEAEEARMGKAMVVRIGRSM